MNIVEALALRGEPDSYERQENAWLLAHILNCSVTVFKTQAQQILSEAAQHAYTAALQRLQEGEPLAYITGSQPFWSLDLTVTPDTLVPRPDTEVLVETVLMLPLALTCRMVDLGTGTGAIALALAKERPNWHVTATDIYQPTLKVAQENAIKHGLSHVQFALGAWYAALTAHNNHLQQFDLIVSNPPYIDPIDPHVAALQFEPQRALVASNSGLADLMIIISQAPQWLVQGGWLVVEHGFDQAQAVQALFIDAGFADVRTVKDYGWNDRVTLGQLLF